MIFLFLIFNSQPTTSLPSLVSVTPCCPPASYLDLTLPTHPACHPSSPPSNTPASITIPGDQNGVEVTVTMLDRGQQSRLPDCTGGLEVHDLSPGKYGQVKDLGSILSCRVCCARCLDYHRWSPGHHQVWGAVPAWTLLCGDNNHWYNSGGHVQPL